MRSSEKISVAGKEALVIGAGLSGLAAARLLIRRGARVTITDRLSADKFSTEVDFPPEARLELGSHHRIDLDRIELAVISPGVDWDESFSRAVRAAGAYMISELELAASFIDKPIIAITGSNGKSSTTTLLGEIFRRAGRSVFVGANLGDPLSNGVDGAHDWFIAEVSSFQLEGIDRFHPSIALILNITPDHLDRHKSFDRYIALKKRIYMNMSASDHLILNGADRTLSSVSGLAARLHRFNAFESADASAYARGSDAFIVSDGKERALFKLREFARRAPGAGALENALAAALAASLSGVADEIIAESIKGFTGLAHRTELIGEIDGIFFVDDSKGTNVDATLKALENYNKDVVVILGGSSKGADFSKLSEGVKRSAKGAVLIGQTAVEIFEALRAVGYAEVEFADDMDDAVRRGFARLKRSETLLLSPACASFGMFRDYKERARIFKEAIGKLARGARLS